MDVYEIDTCQEVEEEDMEFEEINVIGKTMKGYTGCGDIFTLEDFLECCRQGLFMDYDGYGHLATVEEVSDEVITPSRAMTPGFTTHYTHVVWYNR